jgi:phosphoribosylaminoimidazole (AIR) synthetase
MSHPDASRWIMFSWLQVERGLCEEEMGRAPSTGLGAVLVVAFPDAQRVLRQLQAHVDAWIVCSLAHKQPGDIPAKAWLVKHL